jgi:PAS domain-containing protein
VRFVAFGVTVFFGAVHVRLQSLHVQLSTAVQRLASLQRRAGAGHLTPDAPKLIEQTLEQLELALEQLRAAHEELDACRGELAAARQALEEQRQKYWELFDTALDACLVTAPDGEIIEANRAAAELLNITQRFLVGKHFTLFVCTDRGRVQAQARKLAETGGSADWDLEIRPRERAPLDVCARVVANAEEQTLRWILRPVRGGNASAPAPSDRA